MIGGGGRGKGGPKIVLQDRPSKTKLFYFVSALKLSKYINQVRLFMINFRKLRTINIKKIGPSQ